MALALPQLAQPSQNAESTDLSAGTWRAPLVPVTLLTTAGIVLDRYASVPVLLALLVLIAALVGWGVGMLAGAKRWPFLLLLVGCAAGGAAWHHFRRDVYADDDISRFAPTILHPVQLRGAIEAEPRHIPAQAATALLSMDRAAATATVLQVAEVRQRDEWVKVSGRVRLVFAGEVPTLHVGDAVEVVGLLSTVEGPANPGEFDRASYLRDKGIRAQVVVRKTPAGVTRLERGWPASFTGCLMAVRDWGQDVLGEALREEARPWDWLPAEHRDPAPNQRADDTTGVAIALLLGEGAPMTTDDWDKYVRGGVIHVLAISGQHLVILAVFLWWVLRLFGVRQRHGAVFVAVFLLLYALLTGGHPPALRSAVTVCAVALGLVLRRRILPANTFALAFLTVAVLNPTDLFTGGCQLSFVSVAVLYWGTRSWFRDEPDALEKLIDETRPLWWRGLRWLGRSIYETYAITFFIWIVIAPLTAAHYHVVSPAGLLLGPPLLLLAAVALIAGFLLLLSAVVWPPLTHLFAPFVHWSLWSCGRIVEWSLKVPGSHFHVGDVPEWWLWVFYVGLLLVLTQQRLRRHWRWAAVAGVGWLCVGLLAANLRLPSDEMRCTFLAVGHGGCTVIETPDGRVLLYDAGAISGPDVTRRCVAPYLWSRGVRRIDEVFLSHA
jgi:competence protein ComEC